MTDQNYTPYMRPLYAEIASIIDAYHRCVETGNAFAEKHPQLIYDQCPYLNRSAPCSHDFINTQIDQLEQLHFAWKRAFVIGQFSKLVMITVNRVDCIGDFTDRSR